MASNLIDEKPQMRYAVIDLQKDSYYSLGRTLTDSFGKQLEAMLEPAIKSAVNSLVYTLLSRVSEKQYSEEFSKMLQQTLVETIRDGDFKIHDETMSQLYESNKKMSRLIDGLAQRGAQIMQFMNEVKMDGEPYKIKQIIDFIQDIAYPNEAL